MKTSAYFPAQLCIAFGLVATGLAPPAGADIVTGVTATASSEIDLSIFGNFPRSPLFAVNGAGMESGGDNSAITADQRSRSNNGDFHNWMSSHSDFNGVDTAPWFLADLGAVYNIGGVRIFNYAEHGGIGDQSGIGVRHADILISTNGIDFTPLATNFEIAQAIVPLPFAWNDFGTYYSISDFTGGEQTEISFRYMRLDIFSNWYGSDTAYGLAELQFEAVPAPPSIPGDYNGDTNVDTDDYWLWRSLFGLMGTHDADGNEDGVVNAADYVFWRDRVGSGTLVIGTSAVPEPASAVLVLLAGLLTWCPRKWIRSLSIART